MTRSGYRAATAHGSSTYNADMHDLRPPAILLMGPTAAGKTALALELAERLPCDLISVDSALVYRGMDIGTAKPDAATLARHPHHLIDICEPEQSYSAAMFCADAQVLMQKIADAGRIPLLVGGTSLYFRALQRGLSVLPSADAGVRAQLAAEAGQVGWAALHQRLVGLDAKAAERIHPNDPQRIQRALEVILLSGQTLSQLQGRRHPQLPFRLLKLAICPRDRATLHARIALRFRAMCAGGLLDEVQILRCRPGVHAELGSMRAVGYRQAWQFLDGEIAERDWIEQGIFATRQLAKRQITWLRAEADAFWRDPEQIVERDQILTMAERFCLPQISPASLVEQPRHP